MLSQTNASSRDRQLVLAMANNQVGRGLGYNGHNTYDEFVENSAQVAHFRQQLDAYEQAMNAAELKRLREQVQVGQAARYIPNNLWRSQC